MSKSLYIGFLIFCISAQYVYKLAVLTDYILHRDVITQQYCINKDKPSLKCNGKCHLNKRVNIQENNAQNGTTGQPLDLLKKILENITFFYAFEEFINFHIGDIFHFEQHFEVLLLKSSLNILDQVKPPQI